MRAKLVVMVKDIRLLWGSRIHDEPISGLVEVDGDQMWFDTSFDEEADEYVWPRECLLYPLTDDELTVLWRRHHLHEVLVSTHSCFHLPDSERHVSEHWDDIFESGAWEELPETPDYTKRSSVGTFMLRDVYAPPTEGGGLGHAL